MLKAMGGLIRSVMGLAAFAVVAYGGWKWGDRVFPALEAMLGVGQESMITVEGVEPSETLGEETWSRIQAFQDGETRELTLSGAELTSVLRFVRPELVPAGMSNPAIRLLEGRAEAYGDVVLRDFPGLPDLGPIAGMLPDTVTVQITGSVMGFGEGEAALFAQRLEVAGVPLPRQVIPEVLTALGRSDRPGLPPEAVGVILPDGVRSMYVEGSQLVILGDR